MSVGLAALVGVATVYGAVTGLLTGGIGRLLSGKSHPEVSSE